MGEVREADIVTDFRNIVAFYLQRSNVMYAADGTGNENLPLAQAVKLIRPGSIAVEFHCNSFTNPLASGVETLSQERDKQLGGRLCAAVATTLDISNRGAKSEGSGQHSRLAFVRAGGIILELFFLSNPNDLRRYLDKKWLVAREVANILMDEAE